MLKDRQGSPLFLDQDPQGVPLDRCQSDSTEDKPQAHLSLTWAPCLTLHTDSTCLALGVLGLGTAFRTTASLCWAHLPQPCPLITTHPHTQGCLASHREMQSIHQILRTDFSTHTSPQGGEHLTNTQPRYTKQEENIFPLTWEPSQQAWWGLSSGF